MNHSSMELWLALNSVLAFAALTWILIDWVLRRNRLTLRRTLLPFALASLLFTVGEGSLEIVLLESHVGARIGFATAACVWVMVALWVGRKDDF